MDPEIAKEKIEELVANGLLTQDAILNTFSDNIKQYGVLSIDIEQPHLRRIFDAVCSDENGTKIISQSAFISFLHTVGLLPSSMSDAGALIFHSLLYLSHAPFYHARANYLTFDGLVRSLALTDSERPRAVYEESGSGRTRTPADSRRLLFQSLATTRDGRKVPYNVTDARQSAERRAFDFPGLVGTDKEFRQEFCKTNHDEDGDEMFHDLLDVLFNIQPTVVWRGSIPRDAFRPLAKDLLRDGEVNGRRELLHDLSIPQEDFRAVVKLLLFTHFGQPTVQVEQLADLDHVVDCVLKTFVQRPDIGITWEMFDQAVSNAMPELFNGLHHLLSPLYQPLLTKDIASRLPKPGQVATLPVLSQLGSIVSYVNFDNLKLHKYYNVLTTPVTTSALVDQMTAAPDPMILLISGKLTQSGEKAIFGYYLPYSELEQPCVLFELSPIHDVFRGNTSKPGWEVNSDNALVFGARSNGVALILQNDLKQLTVSHQVSGQNDPMYGATEWRGDWRADVEVEEIELWAEVDV